MSLYINCCYSLVKDENSGFIPLKIICDQGVKKWGFLEIHKNNVILGLDRETIVVLAKWWN